MAIASSPLINWLPKVQFPACMWESTIIEQLVYCIIIDCGLIKIVLNFSPHNDAWAKVKVVVDDGQQLTITPSSSAVGVNVD